jgi:N-acetylmuramoyl-L-alanine amidase
MPASANRPLTLLISLLAVALIAGLIMTLRPDPTPPPPTPNPPTQSPPTLSALARPPEWPRLNLYQNTITRDDFRTLLTTVLTTGDAWRNFIEISETSARIQTGEPPPADIFTLHFAPPGLAAPTPRQWKSAADLPPPPEGKPLDGLHIAIDPGHIGGEWAKMEERWFSVDGQPAVTEGDMTLLVAKLLRPQLEALGARISLVREKPEPVTPLRPESLIDQTTPPPSDDSPAALQKLAERLFYRTAEIRARADLVNLTLKPDLVLCLHFNAESWGDPNQPTLIDRSHLHLLLNGAYNNEEISLADQRFAMLEKLLQRTHDEEAELGTTVAEVFAKASGLPPFIYPPNDPNSLPVRENPYLWARNLLANRLYDCPVVFMEPYVMNSITDHARIQAGDYEGTREILGQPRISIFREYASALAEALAKHYSDKRR